MHPTRWLHGRYFQGKQPRKRGRAGKSRIELKLHCAELVQRSERMIGSDCLYLLGSIVFADRITIPFLVPNSESSALSNLPTDPQA